METQNLSEDAHVSMTSASTASLDSVIYLGYYRKIPQLITLDENNDSVKIQNEDKVQRIDIGNKTIKPSTYTFEETTSKPTANNSYVY